METDFATSTDEIDFGGFSHFHSESSHKGMMAGNGFGSPDPVNAPETITVVGGAGKMGGLFVKLFRESGFKTKVADISNGPLDCQDIAKSDIIVLALPMGEIEGIIEELGPLTSPDSSIIDISSLKKDTMDLLTEKCNAQVIGCHPLFGPAVESFEGRLFFLCCDSEAPWSRWFTGFLRDSSAIIVEKQPDEHDKLMAVAQSLRHMMLIAFGLTLKRLGFDLERDLELSGPWFGELVELLKRQMDQPAWLYTDIALMNNAFPEVFQAFSEEVWDLFHKITQKDHTGLVESMNNVSQFMEGSK